MSPVRPSCAVRPACRDARVGSCAPAWSVEAVRLNRFGYGRTSVLMPRAHCSPENRTRRVSARRSAVKTDKNGAFRHSKKPRRFCRLRAKRGLDGANAPRATITRGFPVQCAART